MKELEKEQTKPEISRRKEIKKIREEINKTEIKKNKKTLKINQMKSCFFERVNKIDKPVAMLIKKGTERTQEVKKGSRTRWQRSRGTCSPSPTNTTKKAHLQNK